MIRGGPASKDIPLNIVGGNTFGRYPNISSEQTWNMYVSDNWLVPYAGYEIGIPATDFAGGVGRGFYSSANFDRLVTVIGKSVFLVTIEFDQTLLKVTGSNRTKIGELQSDRGRVYITENNKPQIAISDARHFYVYDPSVSPELQLIDIGFIPTYIDFHDTYILAAVKDSSTWRISQSNECGTPAAWPSDANSVGALETKPDTVQAVVRFPSRGNLVFVFGKTVTEAWYDTGAALFPYSRNNSFNIDYGCINRDTIATMDELVVWLGINEKAGPVIMYSTGQMPQKIPINHSDGLNFLFNSLQNPEDAEAFIFRQDGHIFYHLNFYSDNLSLVYDFTSHLIYYASDENRNYFIGSEVAFYRNQYYFLTRNNGNLYVLDTRYTTYDGREIPRIRVCKNIRLDTQDYFVCTRVGFTVESGNTNYIYQATGITFLGTLSGDQLVTQGGDTFVAQQHALEPVTPKIDLSISNNGGESYGSEVPQILPHIGLGRNKLYWWQIGASNDLICQFRFHGIGRFICYEGVATIRV